MLPESRLPLFKVSREKCVSYQGWGRACPHCAGFGKWTGPLYLLSACSFGAGLHTLPPLEEQVSLSRPCSVNYFLCDMCSCRKWDTSPCPSLFCVREREKSMDVICRLKCFAALLLDGAIKPFVQLAICFVFVLKRQKQRSSDSPHKCLQQLGLGPYKARSLDSRLGLPCGWPGPKHLNHHCYFPGCALVGS